MRTFKLFALPLLCLSLGGGTAHAADAPPVKQLPAPIIAIVDIQRILQESLAAQSVQKQLDVQRGKFQSEIEGEENGLRQAEQDLTKERDKVTPQAYADHEQQLRQRFSTVENHVQARRKVLDKAYSDAMDSVHTAVLDVVEKAAHSHGANLVIVKQQAFWTDQPLDITDEVLKNLDQKLPQVKITMPVEPPVPATPEEPAHDR